MSKLRLVRAGALGATAAATGVLLAVLIAAAALASSTATVSPRDDCGGFNGHVVWAGPSGASIQLYGEVWDTGCPGSSSVWLSWDSPGYNNIQAGAANEPQTEGVNYQSDTSQTPTNIKVTVCSTNGGWHCGAPVTLASSQPPTTTTTMGSPPTTTTSPSPTTATTTTPPTTPEPVATTPVPVAPSSPTTRALRIRLTISWTWDAAITRVRTVTIGSFPRRTRLTIRCRGGGCPQPAASVATGKLAVRRALQHLEGHHYASGDVVLLGLRAPGWLPEQAKIVIRHDQVPLVRLLGTA